MDSLVYQIRACARCLPDAVAGAEYADRHHHTARAAPAGVSPERFFGWHHLNAAARAPQVSEIAGKISMIAAKE